MQNHSLHEEIRAYWQGRAATYDASPGHGLGDPAQAALWRALFTRHLGPAVGRRVLDLGCGTGEITLLLHGLGFDATGLDMTPAMLARARQKAAGLPLRFIEADAAATMEPGASYDVITARYLFWTLTDPAAALAEWHRLLRPGGMLLLVDGDHVTPPPLSRLAPLLDRLLGKDRAAAHALVTPAQWQAHQAIVARLPYARGLRAAALCHSLTAAGFRLHRCDSRAADLAALRASGWRQRLLALGRHRFVLSACRD